MKRQLAFILFISLFATYVFLSTLIVVGCGGGGGGGGGGAGPTPLATGTFIKTDVLDGGSGPNSGVFSTNSFRHYQVLYRAQELTGSGNITTVWLRLNQAEAAAISCPNTTIKLGHTSVTDLSVNMTNNVEQGRGSLVTVVNDATIVIPSGAAGDYFDIPLETAFNYNGVDNLVLDITRVTACSATAEIRWTAATTAFVNYAYSDNPGTPDTAGFTGNGAFDAKFTFAGGDNAIEFGGADWNFWPFSSELPRTQHLYLASEIDGSGPITGIGLQLDGATTTAETYTYTVKMGHTSLSALGATYDSNYDVGSPVTVANNATFTVPAGIPAGSYFWVPLPDGSFSYNGNDNLIVEFDISAGTTSAMGADVFLRVLYSVAGRRAWGFHGNATADAVDDTMHHIKFRFNGGTMDVMTSGGGFQVPFNGTIDHVLQVIYGANDLGTNAQIDKVAFRLSADSIADDYTGFSVVMGHTTNTTLSMTLADNMDDPTNVFSGTVNIPSGLKAGDWVEIPVSGFTYNPLKNLTIQVTTNMGIGNNTNPIFAGSRAISGAGVASIGSPTFDLATGGDSAALKLSYTKY